ncbi:MAG TPA: hypothetical protein VNF04_04230 [Stellaceae bacterium]|nr:hypothetical protein [Stellaceae bacterium]
MATINREQKVQSVLNALNNPNFEWRTIEGVRKDAHLDADEAIGILGELQSKGLVIQSNSPSEDGRYLFITRERFNQRATLGEKILGAVRNRIV